MLLSEMDSKTSVNVSYLLTGSFLLFGLTFFRKKQVLRMTKLSLFKE